MVQEHFRNVTQILAIDLLDFAIELKHAHFIIPVDFIPRRISHLALFAMTVQFALVDKEK